SSTLRRPASVFSVGTQTPSAGSRQIQHAGRASFVSALPAKLSHHGAVARKHLVKAGDKQSAEAYGEPRLATAELVGGACFWGLMYWLFFKAVAHITKLVQAIPELEIGSFLALSLIPLLLVRKDEQGAVFTEFSEPSSGASKEALTRPCLDLAIACAWAMSVRPISDDRFAVVIKKNTSQDTESFGFAMLTSTLIGVSSCVAFYFLRQRYPMVYEGSTSHLPQSKGELPAQAFGFFGWLRTSVSYRFDDVIDHVGMDQIMLLEFTHLSMKVMFGIGIPALMVLAPLHARSGGADDDLSRIGLSNLDAETWILWVHAAFVWYVVLLVLCLVYRAQHRKFRPRRSRWLSNMPEARATTRLVEGIPEQLRTDAAMARFFDQIFGQPVVKDVIFVRDTSSLLPLIEARDMLSEELAQVGLQYAASHEAGEAASPRRLQTLERRYNRSSAAAEEMATRVFSCQSFASDAAFVTFRDRRHAEFARGLRYSESRGHFAVSLAPEPFDVHFASFTRSSASVAKGSALVGRLLVACVFFFFLPVVIGISSLLSVDSLTHLVPKLEVWSREYQYITTAWEALLGTSLLSMLMDLVPWMLSEVFSRFYRLRSGSKGQHKIQRWYFFFLVVFVLLVTAVGTSLFEAAARLAQEPLKVWYLLADQLPDSTNFYLRYAVLLWSTPFFDLVRCFPLLYFWKALQAG
ncbi:unnamed protein product, partial [Symbiodinium microadriaticum]